MKIPNWAQDLTLSAILYLQSKGFKAELPNVIWRHHQSRYSSGHADNKDTITVCAGGDRTDQKLVLLHEIAHTIIPSEEKYLDVERAKKRGWVLSDAVFSGERKILTRIECHTDAFWDLAWELYRWAGLPVRYCLERERSYRKGSVLAYKRSKRLK